MLVAAAVCPHPPLLIPEAMGAAGHTARAEESRLGELRAACAAAVAGLAAARPDLLAVVGGAARTARYDPAAVGSLRGFGIPVTIGAGEPVLPLSLTAGSWLLRSYLPDWLPERADDAERRRPAAGHGGVLMQAVRRSWPAADCLRVGAELAARPARVALLVMGDGSARRAVGAPGAADPAADAYDAEVAAALAAADPARLARLDPALDDELIVAGRAAWQVLAGAAGHGRWRGLVRFAGAPLGVSYFVASWAPS